ERERERERREGGREKESFTTLKNCPNKFISLVDNIVIILANKPYLSAFIRLSDTEGKSLITRIDDFICTQRK
ncbi:MAG: hypothetical protein MJE68_07045, partial [Proteobacteria bacterium]|nr:hypothetical protein [Pseudomonadota bacterium]